MPFMPVSCASVLTASTNRSSIDGVNVLDARRMALLRRGSRVCSSGARRAASSTTMCTPSPVSTRLEIPGASCSCSRTAARLGRNDRQHALAQPRLQARGRVAEQQPSLMQQRHAMAALGLVQISSRSQNGDAFRQQLNRGFARNRGAKPGPRQWSARPAESLWACESARRPGRVSASFRRRACRPGACETRSCPRREQLRRRVARARAVYTPNRSA